MDKIKSDQYEAYFQYLKRISLLGRIYKRFIASPVLFWCGTRFGSRLVEVGCGTGSGVLGAFSRTVIGIDINPFAVEFCNSVGLRTFLIQENGEFPLASNSCDVCVLDNVLEHIEYPRKLLDECYRVTSQRGGLVVAVPGVRGYRSDSDHRVFYDAEGLKTLDERWELSNSFSIPFFFTSNVLSQSVKQYCLVAVYKKVHSGSLSQ